MYLTMYLGKHSAYLFDYHNHKFKGQRSRKVAYWRFHSSSKAFRGHFFPATSEKVAVFSQKTCNNLRKTRRAKKNCSSRLMLDTIITSRITQQNYLGTRVRLIIYTANINDSLQSLVPLQKSSCWHDVSVLEYIDIFDQ